MKRFVHKGVLMIPSEAGTLEFQKLKEMVETYAVSSSGKSRTQAAAPQLDADAVRRELQATDDVKHIELSHQGLPLHGLRTVDAHLTRLEKGSVLEPETLVEIAGHLRVSRKLLAFLIRIEVADEYPELARRCSELARFPSLEERLEASISPEGEVLNSASPELRRIRHALHRVREQIQERLEGVLRNPSNAEAIQERVITLRNDRYVVPIRQDFRGQVPGVVQGMSASGVTVFVEPLAVVEANNELHALFQREHVEVQRILRELSDELRAQLEGLRANASVLTELDFLRAKARFAVDYACITPIIEDHAVVELRKARHPILEHRIRQERSTEGAARRVVPIDITLGERSQGVIVTGPNTGGKTVALKTVGLLTLMAMSGIPVPADYGSRFGLFTGVFADIGDEQSIEQSLSTFSSHLTRIIRYLANASPSTLVLLDEIGAGTDPDEGAALAMALLDGFLNRGALVLVTTHYGALKAYAHESPHLINASMEFDLDTLSPTFRMQVGLPGSSHAVRIAERL
ncbi:endonuclease MutS2, partial [Candidatus Poribacteria bacterium]|nr:endonuclease MutS2 [Candidatus Poribacteria bacterium]